VPLAGVAAHFIEKAGFSDPGLPPLGSAPFNDIAVDAPDESVLLEDALTDNDHVILLFQGARPVRPGSRVPGGETLTAWVSDLTALDGFPLVRFRVAFDLAGDVESFPYGVDSLRPLVDYVRMRVSY
jgi:hypothetical protein